MDRSRGSKRARTAEPAATVQSFAGSILNKHRAGRGRDRYGGAPMLHAKPKGESAGVQQRIHIHVTPPRSAEPKKPRKEEKAVAPRIIERETIKTERQTIVIREVVRIVDNQRAARALAMTAPVQQEAVSQHRQYPDAAAPAKQREAGMRRLDHHSGSQPASTQLGITIHKELATWITQGRNADKLRRLIADGASPDTLITVKRGDARPQGDDKAAAPVAARKRPVTYVHREANQADPARAATHQAAERASREAARTEQAAERASREAARTEQAAMKRRATEAAAMEQAAERASREAARTEQAAKRRRDADGAVTEQAAERASREAARTEQTAKKRRATEQAAERASQEAARTKQASKKRRKADGAATEQAAERAIREADSKQPTSPKQAAGSLVKPASQDIGPDVYARPLLEGEAAREETGETAEQIQMRTESNNGLTARVAFSALKKLRRSKDLTAIRQFPELIGARRRVLGPRDADAAAQTDRQENVVRSRSEQANAAELSKGPSSSNSRDVGLAAYKHQTAGTVGRDTYSHNIGRQQTTAAITVRRLTPHITLSDSVTGQWKVGQHGQSIRDAVLQRVAAMRANRLLSERAQSEEEAPSLSQPNKPSFLKRGSALIFRRTAAGHRQDATSANAASNRLQTSADRPAASGQPLAPVDRVSAERGTAGENSLTTGLRVAEGKQPILQGKPDKTGAQSLSREEEHTKPGMRTQVPAASGNRSIQFASASQHSLEPSPALSGHFSKPALTHRDAASESATETRHSQNLVSSPNAASSRIRSNKARPSLTAAVHPAPATMARLLNGQSLERLREKLQPRALKPMGLVLKRNMSPIGTSWDGQARTTRKGATAKEGPGGTFEKTRVTESAGRSLTARSKPGLGVLIGRKNASLSEEPSGNANVMAASQRTRDRKGVATAETAAGFQGVGLMPVAKATSSLSSSTKPFEGGIRPTSLLQRQRTADPGTFPIVPLIARPFAAGAMRTAVQDAAGRNARGPENHDSAASSAVYERSQSTLSYGRTTASGAGISGAAVFQQQSASPESSPFGSQPLGLTHRTQPAAPQEPARQVKVEAPRELEPEKLQKMIMKMPQLNPEVIADRVYKALERRMKLEQRRNGY